MNTMEKTAQQAKYQTNESLLEGLREKGIVMLECPFDDATLARWNTILDPEFAKQGDIHRAYVSPPDLLRLGIFDEYWSPKMRSLVQSIMPDAVIETFDCYENKGGQSEEDMYDEVNSEWHRDIHNLPGIASREPMYCSIFIYLSDVVPGSGGFEIRPKDPDIAISDKDEALNVQGKIGTTFLWNRSFYHRSSMNRSAHRRRVFKLSVQHNYLENSSLKAQVFDPLRASEKVKNDPYLKFLLGGSHISTHNGYLMPGEGDEIVEPKALPAANTAAQLGKGRELYRRTRRFIKRKILGKAAKG